MDESGCNDDADNARTTPGHHVRKSMRRRRPLPSPSPEPATAFRVPDATSARLRQVFIWVLAGASFIVPIGAFLFAPLCWLVLWINRHRLSPGDASAGLVALAGVVLTGVSMILD